MDRRTYESPMDWEYQDRGPVDPTSPFTHTLRAGSQSVFSSPTKADSRLKPFTNLKAKSTFPGHPPQTSSFQPKLGSKPTAAPFLNPAFTTPRKPFDDIGLSEASGPEDSPALTDTSDFPNDTPDLDRFVDVNIGSAVTPSKVDKTSRYGRSGLSPKRHASGRGEIRSHRAFAMTDPTRKRKRHLYDRDVGSAALRQQDSYDSDTDYEEAARGQRSSKGGLFNSVFHAINDNPQTPYNLSLWLGLSAVCIVISSLVYMGWGVWSAVQSDIYNANQAARLEILSQAAECREQYISNKCAQKDRPGLRMVCDDWHECMMRDPEAIMKVKATVKEFADVINEFADALSLKAAGLIVTTLLGMVFVAVLLLQHVPGRQVQLPVAQPQRPNPEYSVAPENNQGFFLVPMQTPQTQRHRLMDEETDTDASPPVMRTLLPPTTPSGRRSPSKGQRSQSPTKYRRSPSKGY